jgi:hypothetical protein
MFTCLSVESAALCSVGHHCFVLWEYCSVTVCKPTIPPSQPRPLYTSTFPPATTLLGGSIDTSTTVCIPIEGFQHSEIHGGIDAGYGKLNR